MKVQIGKKEKTVQDLVADLENERVEKGELRERIKQLEGEINGAQISATMAAGHSSEAERKLEVL